MLQLPTLITAFVWAVIVVVPLAGLAAISMPLVFDRAQEALRAHPPSGTPWARRVWQGRERLYYVGFGLLAVVGGGVFLLALVAAGGNM